MANDSHVSMPSTKQADEKNLVPQRHRLKLGLPVDGQKNPYGTETAGKSSVAGGKNW